jgi:hypothetical protein
MLKNILKLDGAQQLTATEQKEIAGGTITPTCNCEYWLAECQLAASQNRRCRIPANCMYCTA